MTLKELRKMKGITQCECANFLGIPLRTYQNYERDDIDTSSIKYQYLFEKLGKFGYVDEEHGVLSIESIKSICNSVFNEYEIQYCYLFGSYAKGKATEKSDVDLFINSSLTGMVYYEMVELLREKLKKKVDILNQEQIKDNFALINEILQDGIKIYG